MKKRDLLNKSKDELIKELESNLLAIRDIRFGAAGSKVKNVKELKSRRKTIARIYTSIGNTNK